MASQEDVLKALSGKDGPVSPADIAGEVNSTRQTVTSLLHKLKGKGLVEGSGTEWAITDTGKSQADIGATIPTTTADVGLDELSKFKRHGQLSTVDHDTITAAAELFQEGDMRSMAHFDNVMASISVPQQPRNRWRALYLSFLRSSTPEETRDQSYPLPEPAPAERTSGAAVLVGEAIKGDDRDFIVDGFDIHRSAEGLGEFTFREALQAVAVKRGTTASPTGEGSSSLKDLAEALKILNPDPTKPLTYEGLLDLMEKIESRRGNGGEEPPPTFYVDGEGNKQQLAPGEPIVIKQPPAQPGKSYYLNPETHQMEEIESGKPIVITVKQGGGDGAAGQIPFPVFGNDGQPVYDKDGNPVVANLEPMMRWMGFQKDEKRKDERHDSLIGLVNVVKENFGDGVSALKMTAEAAKGTGTKAAEPAAEPQPQVFSCGDCQTQFSAPAGWADQPLKCPNPVCGREYTKEELLH